ncbi:P-loop containing nucleoside triphosphate hydrolase protein [Dioscorea alata]|uniref:P-loop containing nucleoside triphosphate hydrolase protein n=1 Tax=Dioscorea alata TaxID=55571 RepID=A0ACB7WM51_DIOAL|nr:P-loop containing nucleoside triphosphate hydrolase protein [Dioscorea alata]
MADSVVKLVASRLEGLLSQHFILWYGVKKEVDWMKSELHWIQGFLKDADVKRKDNNNHMVKIWVNDVIRVAYQAEDAIDTFLIKVPRSKGALSRLNNFKPSVLKARRHVSVEIGKIRESLKDIKDRKEKYNIEKLGEDGDGSKLIPVRRPSPTQLDDANAEELSNDQKILLEKLTNLQPQRLCVISIVGIGGLGKTTLARKLCHHSHTDSNPFGRPIWVTVSQEDSLMGVLRKMLRQVPGVAEQGLENKEENDLIDMINESLRRERFLIVLDDIWREELWNQMRRSFPDANNGSRVLITTRFLNVATQADQTSTPYQLQLLNEVESMKLLLKHAYPNEDARANCPSKLLDIGRHLMRKCGGLPLALVVLGGLLSRKNKTPHAWNAVLQTMDWEVDGKECQKILALSYEDLPYHMKSCFLYLGAYLEGSEISGKELIRKWVAEGFIPQEERRTMEDTAEAILEELIQRSLIHVSTRKNNGGVKKCGVHGLLLDLARSVAKKDGFLTVYSTENDQLTSQTLSRRVAIHKIDDILNSEIDQLHGLRTVMVFAPNYNLISSSMYKFHFLRVLDLIGRSAASLKSLPKEITRMIHLRYLRMMDTVVSVIPSSIGNLQCLETIDLGKETEIPITLWKIKTLRHVLLQRCTPPQSLQLRNLLTLASVTFGSYQTIDWRLPNLRKLKVFIYREHQGAMLTHLLGTLNYLKSLHIEARECPIEIGTMDSGFREHLHSLTLIGPWPNGDVISEFPNCLTKLELTDSRLEQDPMPKLEKLNFLVTLKLSGNVYLGNSMVCSEGGFPALESLFITNKRGSTVKPMPNLEEWSVEIGAMPKLTFLQLTCWRRMTMLPNLQHVMSLQELKLYGMSQELMLRSEMETGVDWDKIKHVPIRTRSFENW